MNDPRNWSDQVRAAVISAINKVFPVLVLLDVVNFTGDEIVIIMALIEQTITTIFLLLQRPKLVPVQVTETTITTEREIETPPTLGG